MEGFDAPQVFYSDNFGAGQGDAASGNNLVAFKKRFKEFLREFRVSGGGGAGVSEGGSVFSYKYRDTLKRHVALGDYHLTINLEDLASFDEELADKVYKVPADFLPLFEEAATEVADEVTKPRPEGQEDLEDSIQVVVQSESLPASLRSVGSDHVSRLVKIQGIIVAASGIKAKATNISLQCRSCRTVIPNIAIAPGFEGYSLPRKCNNSQTGQQTGQAQCPLDPYFIMPDKVKCNDFQILKLQESPDSVPHGEMPRHMQLYVDRSLVDRVVPGNRVTVLGIYSIKKSFAKKAAGASGKSDNVGVRAPYMRVIGIEVETDGTGRTSRDLRFTPEEEEEFRRMASKPDIHDIIARSIAPSIWGSEDIKKAIACLLFGGSKKILPDGLARRGDINVLLLGDPGTAKSQLLKFVERVAPIAIYTSGKGSSAAGLTASVNRDPASRNFVVEGGAMVLADGGVVCIDEFDKMREDDRVAIHEAMEQQTISIAKAGITTTLNSRCSVLAAANSVFGRWDDSKAEENIDFMPTILSRFDTIFIVKDEHNEERDITLAKHVMSIHVNAGSAAAADAAAQDEGELSIQFLKKYINYARARCGPRLSREAGEKLKNKYVLMRSQTREVEEETDKRIAIPITVRQLEAVIRISESLAKMELQPFVVDRHVEESLRLFQVSTMDAAMSGSLSGAEGFTTNEDQELLNRVEKQLKRRFAIGSQVSEHSILQDFAKQKYPEKVVQKVIHFMIRRGELQHRLQRKMLFRLK